MKYTPFIIISVLWCLCLNTLHAEVFNTGSILSSGHLSINLEEQYNTGPEDFIFYAHFGLGLISNTSDLCITLGFPSGNGDTYYGFDIEFSLSDSPNASISIGGHRQGSDSRGADLTLLLSGKFDSVSPYIGLDANYEFIDSGDIYFLNGVLGSEFKFRSNAAILIEGGFQLFSSKDKTAKVESSYVSLGLTLYF